MKYKIDILSKEECISFAKNQISNECVIISIRNTNEIIQFEINNKIKDILSLTFDDITFDIDGYTLFNKKLAKKIKDFVDTYKDNTFHFVIHCTAGISRSGAVGCVLAKYLNGDDSYLFKTGRYIPNKLIYRILSEVFNLEFNDDAFSKSLNLKYSKNITKDTVFKFDDSFLDIIIE